MGWIQAAGSKKMDEAFMPQPKSQGQGRPSAP